MSVYAGDNPDVFRRAVESVYANTLLPDDFILVIDGPVSAATKQVVHSFEDTRGLRSLQLEQQRGLAGALNVALADVRTAWVVRADADDINLPGRFRAQAKAILDAEHPLDLVGGAILEVDAQMTPLGIRRVPSTHERIVRRLSTRSPFNHMTVAMRTELAQRVGGYPELYRKEDYALWAVLIAAGARCANLDEVLVHAASGPDMYRRRGGWRHIVSEWSLQMYLWRLGHKTLATAVTVWVLRAVVFAVPSRMRGWIYRRLLRTPPETTS